MYAIEKIKKLITNTENLISNYKFEDIEHSVMDNIEQIYNIAEDIETIPKSSWIKDELDRIHEEFVNESKKIWLEHKPFDAETKFNRLKSKYESKRNYLERVLSMQETAEKDLEHYINKYGVEV